MSETKFLYYLIFALIIFFIIVISLVITSVSVRTKRIRRLERIKYILATSVGKYLKDTNTPYPEIVINCLKKQLKFKYGFAAITNTMVELQEAILLPQTEKPLTIVSEIGLDSKILKKIKSRNTYDVALSIKYSYELGIIKHFTHVKNNISHKNEKIRREAQLGLFVFIGWNSFKYLNEIEKPIALWQIIRVLEALEKHQVPTSLVDIQRMFFSKHEDNIILALFCANRFELWALKNEVLPLVNHNNEKISKLALQFKFLLERKALSEITVVGEEVISNTDNIYAAIYT